MKNFKIAAFFILLGTLFSCKKEDALNPEIISGLGGDTWDSTAIDKWIFDSITHPYNISVKYKWDQFELDLNKTLVPPKEEKIIPVLGSIKKVWINTYIAEAGLNFFNTYSPKFFDLVGSASYNTDGTITLGTAEGGRKVVLYVLNDFRTRDMTGYVPSDSVNIKQMFHTIEHEFGHILHQTVLYPVAYRSICAGYYTSSWNNVSDADALRDGFITPYSMDAYDEDFVEMIATMLVEGKEGFESRLASIKGNSPNGTTPETAVARLRQKEAIVVSYFKTTWKIDFYSLQTRVRAAIKSLI